MEFDINPVSTFSNMLNVATAEELKEVADKLNVRLFRNVIKHLHVFAAPEDELVNSIKNATVGLENCKMWGTNGGLEIRGDLHYDLSVYGQRLLLIGEIIKAYKAQFRG